MKKLTELYVTCAIKNGLSLTLRVLRYSFRRDINIVKDYVLNKRNTLIPYIPMVLLLTDASYEVLSHGVPQVSSPKCCLCQENGGS